MDNNNAATTTNISYNELLKSIEHWNEYRVPILRISQPDKSLNFQGAMRFYFQDAGQKVATKCVNVTSADTTRDVIDVLIEKFRPDMRMLSVPEYGLYEIHENGDERKLALDERPLFVQLEWNNDDREGRFLLRKMDEKTRNLASQNEEPSLKRKLSKKEKKKQEKEKKQQEKEQEKANKLAAKNKNGIAERLYNELPETSFTRSISNPEAVMKRRRAQKLEKRLQEFSLEGGQEAGGTLRIFGETINKDVSYKTLLLSTKDTAASVVKQILEKYGKDSEDPSNYCLVQLIVPPSATSAGGDNHSVHDLNTSSVLRESILDDLDCPLLINQNHDKSRGILTFHIRHKPADYQKRRKKKPSRAQVQSNPLHPLVVQQLNQRLQINNNNNNSEQYSNQNSPQNSSQTSGSINHDASNPPPAPFETVHSMPTMFSASNGNMMPYQQHHTVSAATLPSRISNHQQANNNVHDMPDNVNGTMQRQTYSQPNMMSHPSKQQQFARNQIVSNNHFPVGHQQMQQPPYMHATGANDQILPALIQVKEDVEDIFLNSVTTHIKPTDTTFRLAPTYVLYMVSRYRASTLFHPELQAPRRAELFVPFTKKIASMIRNAIEVHMREPSFLAFWLANSSDLSHFYKQDKHLSHFTIEAQEILYDSIKASFKYLLTCKQLELDTVLHTFFDEHDDLNSEMDPAMNGGGDPSRSPVLDVLNDTMATMRKNRVNAALAIQIFSHLFHHISKWLFDRLIGVYDRQTNMLNGQPNFAVYCNRIWGERFNRKLAMIGGWAEKQGLEQAADFHLARVTQVTLFLSRRYPPRISQQDLKEACDSCDRLNPVQMRALLQRYQPELPIVQAIIQNILYTMDYRYMAGEYPLEEDFELKIPFLIPDDGYSSEMIRYIPNGLLDFVGYLSKMRVGIKNRDQELCIFTVQPTSSGFWTVYFKNHQPDVPEILDIQLRKKNNSMGLSIIAARGVGQDRLGIYIKSVVKDGAAAMDGRLQAGDQLLEVDGNSLVNITQETAAEIMHRTDSMVTLKIAKQAAIYHNLSDVINSAPTQTIVSPQAVMPPTFVPPVPMDPVQHDPRLMQFHPPERLIQHMQPERLGSMQQVEKAQQVIPERQIHFQPPPPSMMFEDQPSPNLANNQTSPLKSPKKVSWVDTKPHQSLHTLIPPSPTLVPSPSAQAPSPPPEMPSPPSQIEDSYAQDDGDDSQNYLHHYSNNNNDSNDNNNVHQNDRHDMPTNGQNRTTDEEDIIENPPHLSSNGQSLASELAQNEPSAARPNSNGQLDTTTESLTLEDIDEVLSSKAHNNWPEDSSGVIGTQEVYNDPRQRIVKAREERPAADVNIEKLSFQEKLKMFNISAKK